MTSAGLRVEDLVVHFGGLVAVNGANLEAPPGRITGLIGPNGAGKTTIFNACSGLVSGSGRIFLDERDISKLSASARARLGLGRTFQKMELFNSLTVKENVQLGQEATLVSKRMLGQLWASRKERSLTREEAIAAMEMCGITPLSSYRPDRLSTGQRRLVELAMTLVGGFRMLMLDEPSSGLDSHETESFGQILLRVVAETGAGILLVEHDMTLVSSVCEYLYVLDFGRPLIDGRTPTVLSSKAVAAAYLGEDAAEGFAQGTGNHV
jgi:ABC-type branched-subunit amino acid transport system ATPase component